MEREKDLPLASPSPPLASHGPSRGRVSHIWSLALLVTSLVESQRR